MKKLLLFLAIAGASFSMNAQSLSNALWISPVIESDTEFSVSFDFSDVTDDNTMEWQIKTSDGEGGVDFSSPTIAFGSDIAFENLGSGSQTVTLSLGSGGGSPSITDGQEIIWFGKIVDSDGDVATITSNVIVVGATSSPNLSNALWVDPVTAADTEFSVIFDYSEITADNTMEWQVKSSDGEGGVDFDSPTLAFGSDIAFENTGSGSQTVTLSLGSGGGTPTITEGQEIIWFGKLNDSDGEIMTLTSNVTTVGTLGVSNINANGVVMYPNPVSDQLHIQTNLLNAKSYQVFNMLGSVVKSFENVQNLESIDLSDLKTGIYVLRTDKNQQFKFLKN